MSVNRFSTFVHRERPRVLVYAVNRRLRLDNSPFLPRLLTENLLRNACYLIAVCQGTELCHKSDFDGSGSNVSTFPVFLSL